MSVLNLALAHVATRRGDMQQWAEGTVKDASSLQAVCDVAKAAEVPQQKEIDYVVILEV